MRGVKRKWRGMVRKRGGEENDERELRGRGEVTGKAETRD